MRQLVVIGNGMVGHRLVEAVRDRDAQGAWNIVVLGEEPRPAYDRVALSSYFDGATEHDLRLADLGEGVDLRLGERATAIDRQNTTVTTTSGAVIDYDTLVLATGSYPFVPPLPG
ncbi:FAD-dependent oxidoreductase, partial [Nocardiopsis gilva]